MGPVGLMGLMGCKGQRGSCPYLISERGLLSAAAPSLVFCGAAGMVFWHVIQGLGRWSYRVVLRRVVVVIVVECSGVGPNGGTVGGDEAVDDGG